MAVYAISLKEAKNSNGIVFKTNASSLEEAKAYFRGLKKMPEKDFDKIFIVLEVKN